MKQKVNGLKRQTYLSPRTEIIAIEMQSVLCASPMSGNTEDVGISYFIYP